MNGTMMQSMGMGGMMMCMLFALLLFAVLILAGIALTKHLRKPAPVA